MKKQPNATATTPKAATRAPWQRPTLIRMDAADAQNTLVGGNDGILFMGQS